MPHGFTEKEWAKAWRYEQFENKVKGSQTKNVLLNNGPAHYEKLWKEKEEGKRREQEKFEKQCRERDIQQEQQKLKQQQAEREREERARRWRHAQEQTAKAKAKLEKENPPKKPKPKKPKPKTYTESLADNLKNDMLPAKGSLFDAHKVPLNIPGMTAQFCMTAGGTYFEHQQRQKKMHKLYKKGYGSQYKSPSEHFWGRTENDDPMRGICERDSLKIAAEGFKKAVTTTVVGLFATRSPAAFALGAFAGASAIIDETAKQDVRVSECEKNKRPKV